jgi:hypothetical protein
VRVDVPTRGVHEIELEFGGLFEDRVALCERQIERRREIIVRSGGRVVSKLASAIGRVKHPRGLSEMMRGHSGSLSAKGCS